MEGESGTFVISWRIISSVGINALRLTTNQSTVRIYNITFWEAADIELTNATHGMWTVHMLMCYV